jgi:hypothetical protein
MGRRGRDRPARCDQAGAVTMTFIHLEPESGLRLAAYRRIEGRLGEHVAAACSPVLSSLALGLDLKRNRMRAALLGLPLPFGRELMSSRDNGKGVPLFLGNRRGLCIDRLLAAKDGPIERAYSPPP